MALFRRKGESKDARAMRAFATDLGLDYTEVLAPDQFDDLGALPDLPLLREGDASSVSDLVHGDIDGVNIRMFTYASKSYADDPASKRTCCIITFEDAVLPEIFISPRDRLPRLGEQLREGGVAVGSPELMQKFTIQAHSREHARDLIGPELEDWLLACPIPNLRIEIKGGAILGHVIGLPGTEDLKALVNFMRGFHQRIPERTWRLFRKL